MNDPRSGLPVHSRARSLAIPTPNWSARPRPAARERLVPRGPAGVLPLAHRVGDDLDRRAGCLRGVRVVGELALDAFALGYQEIAHGLQFGNQVVDLLHRHAGNAL